MKTNNKKQTKKYTPEYIIQEGAIAVLAPTVLLFSGIKQWNVLLIGIGAVWLYGGVWYFKPILKKFLKDRRGKLE